MLLIPVTNGEYRPEIRALFLEYISWIIDEANKRWDFGWSPQDVERYVADDMQTLDRLLPPNGRCYLAQVDGEFVGVGAIKQLSATVGEIKRMYVRPQSRGRGIGKIILEQLLADAHSLNYDVIYLDSPKFCEKAQALYQSRGFYYIDGPYPGNENARENDFILNFMQLDL
ncbi:MAG: GNAT family N-acetyltransferase [Candidatus Promineifilaceae bacterium]|nr:GNAT family N-acetyltransferase [Candidatus Promineifilaceae bacterium]